MSINLTITNEDILQNIKLFCQIPENIRQIVTRKIIETSADEANLEIKTEELQEAADKFRLMNKLETADDTWAWLQKYSLSLDNFETIIYSELLANKLAQHLFSDKIEPYFFEHQLDYAGVVMYEVILDDEDLAMELFYAIQEGEMNFYEVAHQYVQDKELRRKGGYRGIVSRQDLSPEISAPVFAANPPQLLKPIITSKGVHLILIEEIIEPELNDNLRSQIFSDLFDEWLNGKIKEVEVIKKIADT